MKKLFENKDKDLFEFIIYFLFIIRKSFIRQNTYMIHVLVGKYGVWRLVMVELNSTRLAPKRAFIGNRQKISFLD